MSLANKISFGVFGKKTLEESLREHKNSIRKSIREIDRERSALERQEKELTKNIKNEATQGRMKSVRIMAKDLVRIQTHIQKFYEMRSHLQAVNLRLQTVKSSKAMSDSMKEVSKVMTSINKSMSIPSLQKIMNDFMKESTKLGFSEEMMSETMDQALGVDDDEELEDKIVEQVLDGLGIDMTEALNKSMPNGVKVLTNEASKDAANDISIQKDFDDRLKNLNS